MIGNLGVASYEIPMRSDPLGRGVFVSGLCAPLESECLSGDCHYILIRRKPPWRWFSQKGDARVVWLRLRSDSW